MKKGCATKGKTSTNLLGGSKTVKKKKDTLEKEGSTFKGYQDFNDSSQMDS